MKKDKRIILLLLLFCTVFSSIFMSKEIAADYQLHKVSDIPSGRTTQGSFKGSVRGTWYINGIDPNECLNNACTAVQPENRG